MLDYRWTQHHSLTADTAHLSALNVYSIISASLSAPIGNTRHLSASSAMRSCQITLFSVQVVIRRYRRVLFVSMVAAKFYNSSRGRSREDGGLAQRSRRETSGLEYHLTTTWPSHAALRRVLLNNARQQRSWFHAKATRPSIRCHYRITSLHDKLFNIETEYCIFCCIDLPAFCSLLILARRNMGIYKI
jgi:hypothetical protein